MDDELVVNAAAERLRVRIHPMPSGGFHVGLERLIDAEDAGGVIRGQFWSAVTGKSSYLDTEPLARKMADDYLATAIQSRAR